MRLDKFLADNTDLTRSLASRALKNKEVTVNGDVVKSGALQLRPDDVVCWQGETIVALGARYFMLNKPEGYLCATEEGDHPSVLTLLDEPNSAALRIVGRLDVDTSGLLLITDDGQWLHRITSPKNECPKTYVAQLADPVTSSVVAAFAEGVELRGEKELTKPAHCQILTETSAALTITEGRYHQVKRMFASQGNKVLALHRSSIGALQLPTNLAPGQYRPLTAAEVALF